MKNDNSSLEVTTRTPGSVCDQDQMKSQLLPNLSTEFEVPGEQEYINALWNACKTGNLCMVKYIVTQGLADINCRRGRSRRTPVMTAVGYGQEAVFYFLLSKGCNISMRDSFNDTLLNIACKGGNKNIVRHLIDNLKFDVDIRGRIGFTPAMMAVRYNQKDLLDLLMSKNCDMMKRSHKGNNALHVACLCGYNDLVNFILSRNILNIDDIGQYGYTPVMMAVTRCKQSTIELLVNKGCNLTTTDDEGNNVLHIACIKGHFGIASYLLSLGSIDIDGRGQHRYTAVMIAVQKGKMKIIELLVNNGCDMTAVDEYKENVLHISCRGGHVHVTKFILSNNFVDIESRGTHEATPLLIAAEKGHIEVVKLLVSKGGNLKALDVYQNTVLHVACRGGNTDMVKFLITLEGVTLNLKQMNDFGMTPVEEARGMGYYEIVNFLSALS